METKHELNSLTYKEVDTIKDFKQSVRSSVTQIFSLTTEDQYVPLEAFLENMDHGAPHAFHVYKKALEIADKVEWGAEKYVEVDREMLYFMAISHDSGRFHISENKDKQIRCERSHNKCGMGQIRKAVRNLKKH